jgi:hypothetical protein
VLKKNLFVENVLPGAILHRLSDDEMAAYRAPFANAGEDRRPTLTWPRQIPIDHQNGIFAGTNDLIEKIGGRPPTTLEEFINKHRAAFAA